MKRIFQVVNTMLAANQAKKQAEEQQAGKQKDAQSSEVPEQEKKQKQVGSAEVNEVLTMLAKLQESITPENLEALIGESVSYADIVGYNYGHNLYEGTHKMRPDRVILSSETFPSKMASNLDMAEKHAYVIGDFMWTAWDYLGEAGVGLPVYGTKQAPFSKSYPCLTATCGSFDLTGYPESQAYYAATLWGVNEKPYIGVRPVNYSGEDYTLGKWRLTDSIASWTWPGCEGRMAEIEVFSIGDSVELFLNGTSIGSKKLEYCRCTFKTTYEPGILTAVSYDDAGNEIARGKLFTAKGAAKLQILPEEKTIKADGEDLLFVPIHVTDENGVLNMAEDKRIAVTVSGAGTLLALGSGRPESEEKFLDGSYTSWHGRVLAVVKTKAEAGTIQITASAEGVEPVSTEVETEKVIIE